MKTLEKAAERVKEQDIEKAQDQYKQDQGIEKSQDQVKQSQDVTKQQILDKIKQGGRG